jgi:hypothetical protein
VPSGALRGGPARWRRSPAPSNMTISTPTPPRTCATYPPSPRGRSTRNRRQRSSPPQTSPRSCGAMPEQWRAFFFTLAQTGVRVGELLGLTWRHVHLGDDAHILVAEQVHRGERKKLAASARNSRRTRAGARPRCRHSRLRRRPSRCGAISGGPLDLCVGDRVSTRLSNQANTGWLKPAHGHQSKATRDCRCSGGGGRGELCVSRQGHRQPVVWLLAVSVLEGSREDLWVPDLHAAFPPKINRVDVDARVGCLYGLRNRVAHHEPLVSTDVLAGLDDLLWVHAGNELIEHLVGEDEPVEDDDRCRVEVASWASCSTRASSGAVEEIVREFEDPVARCMPCHAQPLSPAVGNISGITPLGA